MYGIRDTSKWPRTPSLGMYFVYVCYSGSRLGDHLGWAERGSSRSTTRQTTVREQAQVRGLSAPTGVDPVKGAQRAVTAMRE
eukprot:6197647-Pleurochrysis_carterae.AAC.1